MPHRPGTCGGAARHGQPGRAHHRRRRPGRPRAGRARGSGCWPTGSRCRSSSWRRSWQPEVLAAPGLTAYVGRVDGEPCCAGLGSVDRGHVGVFNIATPPAHRRRGFGRAVTARVVADGVRAGAHTAYLQASPMGYSASTSGWASAPVETWRLLLSRLTASGLERAGAAGAVTSRGRATPRGAGARHRSSSRRRGRGRTRCRRRGWRRPARRRRRRASRSSGPGFLVLPTPPGKSESPVNRWVSPSGSRPGQRHRARGVPAQVDDVELELADRHHVALLPAARRAPRGSASASSAPGVRRGAGGAGDLLERPHVVPVLVGGDEVVEPAGALAHEQQAAVRVVGGVDEQLLAGGRAGHQVDVVVHLADRHLADGRAVEPADVASVRRGSRARCRLIVTVLRGVGGGGRRSRRR